jgi:hypothetical protein
MVIIPTRDVQEGDTVEGTVWQTNGTGLDYTFECIGNTKVLHDMQLLNM